MIPGFLSYAREDEEYRQQLEKHLAPLNERIIFWHDQRLRAGDEWEGFTPRLDNARIHLLLISPAYFHSGYCQREMRRALELYEGGQATLIAVIVRPVAWDETALQKFQVLPKDAKPVSRWSDRDEAWLSVVRGIQEVLVEEEAARAQVISSRPETSSGHTADPVLSLVQGLPRRAAHDVARFLGYYLGRAGREGPIFGGRSAELERFDRWLDDPGAPQCLLLTGPGGRGKSALLAHWVRRASMRQGLDVVFFPISVRFGTNRAGLLYHAVAARLLWLRGKQPPSDQDSSIEIWREMVPELLSSANPGPPVARCH